MEGMMRGGYYPSWDNDTFDLEKIKAIKTEHFTHIHYAFLNPNEKSFQYDNIPTEKSQFLKKFNKILHNEFEPIVPHKPVVKTLFSIGGGGGSDFFPHMASNNQASRGKFISSCIKIARDHGFDGIDLDWEFPKDSDEMKNLKELLHEMRTAFDQEGGKSKLLLAAAVRYTSTFPWLVNLSYPTADMGLTLDWINLMCYDYFGPWDKENKTGNHAALYPMTHDGIQKWSKDVPVKKLVMGLPLYARTWKLKNPNQNYKGVGAETEKYDGEMPYYKVMEFNKDRNVEVVNDDNNVAAYSVKDDKWLSYDDTTQIEAKIHYLRKNGLGGYFFWDISMDEGWKISKAASDAISA